VWLAGTTNAFNLVDGLDGLSAGLALISSTSLAAVSIVTGRYDMAAAALILAGALAGFLPFNLYPAKVYLGDTGATAIGFFLGALTLRGGSTTSAGLAVILPILVIGVPVAETLLSMARRLVRRLQGGSNGIFDGDMNHIHHRLMALGYNHRRAVLLLYGIAVLLAACAFISLYLKEENAVLLLVTLLIAAFVGVAKLGYDEFAIIRSGAVLRMYDKPVLQKSLFVAFADFGLIVASIYAAIVLKYDDWSVTDHRVLALNLLALAPTAVVATFAAMGIYRRSWGHASVEDFIRLSAAVAVSSGAALIISKFVFGTSAPLTFFLLYTIIALGVVNGSRASHRILYLWNRRSNREGEPVVIYGAGKGGFLAIREILTNSEIGMKPIGFIDDDPGKIGRIINGYPVLGDLDALESVLAGGAKGVVIASDKISTAKLRYAQRISDANGAWLTHFEVNFNRRRSTEERMAGI
jgi:UDP-GlcNAc:undecaprenyl-phosphate/decaprenyl-phosphate GlcNAc-1-phosphate transferase